MPASLPFRIIYDSGHGAEHCYSNAPWSASPRRIRCRFQPPLDEMRRKVDRGECVVQHCDKRQSGSQPNGSTVMVDRGVRTLWTMPVSLDNLLFLILQCFGLQPRPAHTFAVNVVNLHLVKRGCCPSSIFYRESNRRIGRT